jgi:hypothetical protein
MGPLVQAHRFAVQSSARDSWLAAHETQLASIFRTYGLKPEETNHLPLLDGFSSGEIAMVLRIMLASPNRDKFHSLMHHVVSAAHDWIDSSRGIQQTNGSWTIQSPVVQRFYAGQMALALLEFFEVYGQPSTLSLAEELLDWLALEAEPIKTLALHPSSIPWYASALFKRAQLLNEPEDWRQLQKLSLSLLKIQDTKMFPGRFWLSKGTDFGPPNTVRDAQSTRTLMMGLKASIRLADRRAEKKLKRAILLALDNLIAHQYTPGVTDAFPRPSDAIGAVRFRYNDPLCRIDSTVFASEVFEMAAELARADRL